MVIGPVKQPAMPIASHKPMAVPRVASDRNRLPNLFNTHKLTTFPIRPSPMPRMRKIKLLVDPIPAICRK